MIWNLKSIIYKINYKISLYKYKNYRNINILPNTQRPAIIQYDGKIFINGPDDS